MQPCVTVSPSSDVDVNDGRGDGLALSTRLTHCRGRRNSSSSSFSITVLMTTLKQIVLVSSDLQSAPAALSSGGDAQSAAG